MMWGTYDLGKPRTRLLLEAIRQSGASLCEVHAPVWDGAEDKSVLGKSDALRRGIRWAFAYPGLIWRFLRAPRPDVIVVGYLGQLDVLLLWPFAKMRGVPVVWDAFLSLYDTVVNDRAMVTARHPAAWVLRAWEWLACRSVHRIVLDTEAHADLFRNFYNVTSDKVTSAFVGAEASAFPTATPRAQSSRSTVLFYGQFIPLHGIATIINAAKLAGDKPIDWVVIGTGQQEKDIAAMLEHDAPKSLMWEKWVPYEDLAQRIADADVCLGVFGTSEKAGRVIPNKVFQILSAGRPLVTRDGPGIRELISDGVPGVELIPPADPKALVVAVERLLAAPQGESELHTDLRKRFAVKALAGRWDKILRDAIVR
ncbi:MAG: glycosyltransferase [Paracoccaceae bacterium]